MKSIIKRFKSPVVWLAIVGLIYSAVIVPEYPQLPEWSVIVGYIAVLFGVANNPTESDKF